MGLGAEASHIFSSELFYTMFDKITQISLSPHSHHACFSMSSTLDTYISVSVQPMFAFCTWLASLSATSSDSIHIVVWTGFPSCEALATLPLSCICGWSFVLTIVKHGSVDTGAQISFNYFVYICNLQKGFLDCAVILFLISWQSPILFSTTLHFLFYILINNGTRILVSRYSLVGRLPV